LKRESDALLAVEPAARNLTWQRADVQRTRGRDKRGHDDGETGEDTAPRRRRRDRLQFALR
jgi:hypothetical protein